MLFVGEKGQLLADYGRHMLLPLKQFKDFQAPEPSIPPSIGHHREWIQAAKTGTSTPCNFDYGGKMTENLLAGIVSCRVKEKLRWDSQNLRAAGCPEADPFIRKQYPPGWPLVG
jgi:hypothetical protein